MRERELKIEKIVRCLELLIVSDRHDDLKELLDNLEYEALDDLYNEFERF
jgi:hypothetical protein